MRQQKASGEGHLRGCLFAAKRTASSTSRLLLLSVAVLALSAQIPGAALAQSLPAGEVVADLSGFTRPVRDGDGSAGNNRRAQERSRIRQVGLDGNVVAGNRAGLDAPHTGFRRANGDAAGTKALDGHVDVWS